MSTPARRSLAVILPLAGAAAGLLTLRWSPPLFQGRCLVALEPSASAPGQSAPTPEILWRPEAREALTQALEPMGLEPDAFLSRLAWRAIDGSTVFELRFPGADPQRAAAGANAAAAALERLLVPARDSEPTARERLSAASAEIRRLSASPGADLTLLEERRTAAQKAITDLQQQYARARAARLDLEARWNALRQPEQVGELVSADAPELASLREERAQLEQRRAELEVRFGPRWPEMKELASRIEQVDARIASKLEELRAEALNDAESDYQQAFSQERALERSLRAQQQEIKALEDRQAENEGRQARLADLESERAALESRLSGPRAVGSAAGVRILSAATLPTRRTGLPLGARIAAGLAIGALLGLGSLRVAERLDPSLTSPREAEEALDAPFLAHIPEIPGGPPPGLLRLESAPPPGVTGPIDPLAAAARAIRDLRTGLLLTRGGEPARVLLVTACRRGEGKTFVACHLALALARRGVRVVLIDANLRRPRAHRLFGLAPGPGLVDVLAGSVQLEEAVRATNEAGLFLMPAGDVNGGSAELLDGASLRHLRDRLLQPSRFQHVVIDAGEVGAAAATERLAVACTGLLLVARARRTTSSALRQAAATLRRHGASHLVGVWIGPEPAAGAPEVRPRAGEPGAIEPTLPFGEPTAVAPVGASRPAVAGTGDPSEPEESAEVPGPAAVPGPTAAAAGSIPSSQAAAGESSGLDPEVMRRLERLRDRLGRIRGPR